MERQKQQPLQIDRLRELLHYDPETGLITNRVSRMNRAKAGSIAGSRMPVGYITICIEGKKYYAHRLAFAFQVGRWPAPGVDHINGVKDDNRWMNLREATQSLNSQNHQKAQSNSKTGVLGVHPAYLGKWKAQITRGGKPIHLGVFDSIEEASEAYRAAKPVFHHESMPRTQLGA